MGVALRERVRRAHVRCSTRPWVTDERHAHADLCAASRGGIDENLPAQEVDALAPSPLTQLHVRRSLWASSQLLRKPLTLCGRFRQDLWYRLNVFPITVPPLRQRPEDIPLLLNHFIEKHCRRLGKPVLEISKATMKVLQARDWPGNIRELENVVERAVISSRGSRFEISDDSQIADSILPSESGASNGRRTLAQLERDQIVATLERLQ
jgi:DNA-binding NtrC family response regulator